VERDKEKWGKGGVDSVIVWRSQGAVRRENKGGGGGTVSSEGAMEASPASPRRHRIPLLKLRVLAGLCPGRATKLGWGLPEKVGSPWLGGEGKKLPLCPLWVRFSCEYNPAVTPAQTVSHSFPAKGEEMALRSLWVRYCKYSPAVAPRPKVFYSYPGNAQVAFDVQEGRADHRCGRRL